MKLIAKIIRTLKINKEANHFKYFFPNLSNKELLHVARLAIWQEETDKLLQKAINQAPKVIAQDLKEEAGRAHKQFDEWINEIVGGKNVN